MMLNGNSGPRVRLTVTSLEDRTTPAGFAVHAAAGPFAVGVPDGRTGDVVVYNADRTVQYTVTAPYGEDFTGGVRVALADVTGDGTADLITAPGSGTEGVVKVFDGVSHEEVASFTAFEADFTGGVYVAAADLTGDGRAEIVVAANQDAGTRVAVFDGATVSGTAAPSTLADFVAIEDTDAQSRVRLNLKDITGDGVADLQVAAGRRGGSQVALDGASLAEGQEVELMVEHHGAGCGAGLAGPGPGMERFGGHGGRRGPGGSPVTVGDADEVVAGVVGTYTGSGSGVLSTLSTTGSTPTTTTENVSVSVNITSATPITRSDSTDDQPLRGLTLTGTITVTVGTADPVTLPFTGTLQITGGTASAVTGNLRLTTDRTSDTGVTTTTGFTLTGRLSNGTISVGWLVLSDHSDPPAGYVFQTPATRDAERVKLTRG